MLNQEKNQWKYALIPFQPQLMLVMEVVFGVPLTLNHWYKVNNDEH